jgi:cytochrome P450
MGALVYAAVDSGELTAEEAPLLVRSFLSAGVDTTVNGLANALYCLATHPGQWQILNDDPSLARAAFEEALRHEAAVQTFFRTTTRPVEISGVRLGEGEKVLLFLAAANRDPRRWNAPERFDIRRPAIGHVGFGAGIHGCVGQMVARLEGELVLAALARRVKKIELLAAPRRRLNNTLRGLASLPVRVTPMRK